MVQDNITKCGEASEGGCLKSVKKCHVLYEWPIKVVFQRLDNCDEDDDCSEKIIFSKDKMKRSRRLMI